MLRFEVLAGALVLPKSFCFTLTCSPANISYLSRDIRYNSSAARISLTQACEVDTDINSFQADTAMKFKSQQYTTRLVLALKVVNRFFLQLINSSRQSCQIE